MIIAGIDYSLTSPGVCVHEGDTWDPSRCVFHYLHKKPRTTGSIRGSEYPEWSRDQDRFEKLATWALKAVGDADFVFLEGYAFAATGRVFHIAECTGLLKHGLWRLGKAPTIFTPSEVKKFASGKGNADKTTMAAAFLVDTKIDFCSLLDIVDNSKSPASDMSDAYFVAKLGHSRINTVASGGSGDADSAKERPHGDDPRA